MPLRTSYRAEPLGSVTVLPFERLGIPVTSVLPQVQIPALGRDPLLALGCRLELGERLLDVVGEDVAPAEAVDERQHLWARVAVVQGAPDLQEHGAALGAERVGAVEDAHDLDV